MDLRHVTNSHREPQNKNDCRTKKDQNVNEQLQPYSTDQTPPLQYLHPEPGPVDVSLRDYSGKTPTQEQLARHTGKRRSHNQSKVHQAGERKDNNCGQASNQHLLEEDPYHQSPLVSHNSNHHSGVNNRWSANRREKTNEINKRKQQHRSIRAHSPQAEVSSSRHQALVVITKGSSQCTDKVNPSSPCPDIKLKSSSPCPDMVKSNGKLGSDCHHSNHDNQLKYSVSGGSGCDQVFSNKEANPFNNQQPVMAIHQQSGDYEAVDSSPDSNVLSDEFQHDHSTGQNNRKGDLHTAHHYQDQESIIHGEIGGSHPHGEEINHEAGEQECREESDSQAHNSSPQQNKHLTGHFSVQNQGAHSRPEGQPHHQNASKHTTRKAAAIRQNPDRTGVNFRKRSATFPPDRTKRSKNGQFKTDGTKRPQLFSEHHIPIPVPTNKGTISPRRDTKFSRLQANQTSNATTKSTSNSRNDEFSRQIPLPPIGRVVDDGYDNVKKKSTTREQVAKSHSQANRPSTKQSKHIVSPTIIKHTIMTTGPFFRKGGTSTVKLKGGK